VASLEIVVLPASQGSLYKLPPGSLPSSYGIEETSTEYKHNKNGMRMNAWAFFDQLAVPKVSQFLPLIGNCRMFNYSCKLELSPR